MKDKNNHIKKYPYKAYLRIIWVFCFFGMFGVTQSISAHHEMSYLSATTDKTIIAIDDDGRSMTIDKEQMKRDKALQKNLNKERKKLLKDYKKENKEKLKKIASARKNQKTFPGILKAGKEFVVDKFRYTVLQDSSVSISANEIILLDSIIIPKNVEYRAHKYKVVEIADCGFSYSQFKKVEFHNSLLSIGEKAFFKVPLVSLYIPSSVKEIGQDALTPFNSIIFDNEIYDFRIANVEQSSGGRIDERFTKAFGQNIYAQLKNKRDSLNRAIYNGEPFTIGDLKYRMENKKMFVDGSASNSVAHITIPTSISFLKDRYSVTGIRQDAFRGHSLLESVKIPESITIIGSSAFEGCTSLKEINLLSTIEQIDSNAFRRCTSLEYVKIPSTKTRLGDKSFMGCTGLKKFVMPIDMEFIGNDVFEDCLDAEIIGMDGDSIVIRASYISDESELKIGENVITFYEAAWLYAGNGLFECGGEGFGWQETFHFDKKEKRIILETETYPKTEDQEESFKVYEDNEGFRVARLYYPNDTITFDVNDREDMAQYLDQLSWMESHGEWFDKWNNEYRCESGKYSGMIALYFSNYTKLKEDELRRKKEEEEYRREEEERMKRKEEEERQKKLEEERKLAFQKKLKKMSKEVREEYADLRLIDYWSSDEEVLQFAQARVRRRKELAASTSSSGYSSRSSSQSYSNSDPASRYVNELEKSFKRMSELERDINNNPMSQISGRSWIATEFDNNFYPALRKLIQIADQNSNTSKGYYYEQLVKKWYNIGKLIARNYNLSYAIFQ